MERRPCRVVHATRIPPVDAPRRIPESRARMTQLPPVWVTLSLAEPLTTDSFAARAKALGVHASPGPSGLIQLPHGFLAWIDPQPFPARLLDTSAARSELSLGPACLHITGGSNDLARDKHQQPAAIRQMQAQMAADFALISTPPGATPSPRVISDAAVKLERLTGLLLALLPLARALVLPQANHIGFSAAEFAAMAADIGAGSYHFPLYTFLKSRPDPDGAHACTTGMFVLGLPELAMPLGPAAPLAAVGVAIGNLQREMVAEGWWPEHDASFATELGPVHLERTQDAVFAVPTDLRYDAVAVAVARRRWTLQRCATREFGPGTLHRVRSEGTDLIVDHHLRVTGSFAMTNGLSLAPQPGGRAVAGNDHVELLLRSEALGPWATGWLLWVAAALRGHDGARPLCPYDRVVCNEPIHGIAAVILWPHGSFTLSADAPPVHLLVLLPITSDELASFRADPSAQTRWADERRARDDLADLHARWTAR